jgi:hypothetical protein
MPLMMSGYLDLAFRVSFNRDESLQKYTNLGIQKTKG